MPRALPFGLPALWTTDHRFRQARFAACLPYPAVTSVLNISCYKFMPLPDAAELRERLHAQAVAAGLKGTILLAEEGINFFLAGTAQAVRGFVDGMRVDERFADLEPKESWSDTVPFRKMLVKVKREIIRMDHPTIRPAQGRAPSVDQPRCTAGWNKAMTTLAVRW